MLCLVDLCTLTSKARLGGTTELIGTTELLECVRLDQMPTFWLVATQIFKRAYAVIHNIDDSVCQIETRKVVTRDREAFQHAADLPGGQRDNNK